MSKRKREKDRDTFKIRGSGRMKKEEEEEGIVVQSYWSLIFVVLFFSSLRPKLTSSIGVKSFIWAYPL